MDRGEGKGEGGRNEGGPGGPRQQREERPTKSACNPRVPKAQNKLLRASCLACSIFGAGTTIPGAESCGSVGKLGDPVGATTSNGDVREEGEGRRRRRGRGTQVDRERRGHEEGRGGEDEVGIRDSPSGREDRGRFPKRGGRRG